MLNFQEQSGRAHRGEVNFKDKQKSVKQIQKKKAIQVEGTAHAKTDLTSVARETLGHSWAQPWGVGKRRG